jgi:hypothetical protein
LNNKEEGSTIKAFRYSLATGISLSKQIELDIFCFSKSNFSCTATRVDKVCNVFLIPYHQPSKHLNRCCNVQEAIVHLLFVGRNVALTKPKVGIGQFLLHARFVLIAGYLQNSKITFENRDSSIVDFSQFCHGTVPRHPFNGIKK